MTPSLKTFDSEVKLTLTHGADTLYGARMSKKDPSDDTPDPIRIGIGQRLKTARQQKGLTQLEVAEKFGINKATVSAWETGAGAPDALRLRRLARMYDVSADAILWDDSLTTEALRFAAQFDALTDKQQRAFRAMWLAYFEEAVSDEGVEQSMPITKHRRATDAQEIRDGLEAHTHQHRRKTDRA